MDNHTSSKLLCPNCQQPLEVQRLDCKGKAHNALRSVLICNHCHLSVKEALKMRVKRHVQKSEKNSLD